MDMIVKKYNNKMLRIITHKLYYDSNFMISNRAALGRVCIKLVVVMGITWSLDVLSWVHSTLDGNNYAFWIVPDLINALHGVFIFIVVGCQPQVNRILVFILSLYNVLKWARMSTTFSTRFAFVLSV